MESDARGVSKSDATDPPHEQRTDTLSQVAAVDPAVAVDSVSVEAAAMDHAVITVDAGVGGLTGRRFYAASSPVSNAPSVGSTLSASLIALP
jgi:hypothetical protein